MSTVEEHQAEQDAITAAYEAAHPTRMICPICGSDEVTRDGLLRWNGHSWEASSELDNMQCDDCGEETNEFDELPVVAISPDIPHDQMWVRVYNGDPTHGDPITLAEFFDGNADGIDADEQALIIAELSNRGTYHGGGGAAAEWRLWLTPGPEGVEP